jgi:hypothetical protein
MQRYNVFDGEGEVVNLTRHQARAIEQYQIEKYGLDNLQNTSNSIAVGRVDTNRGPIPVPVYAGANDWASQLIIE